MYAPVYFAPRFFPRAYFSGGTQSVKPRYFHHGFFPVTFYPDRYFPGDAPVVPVGVKPRYFLHSFFTDKFFADHYFPGDVVSIVIPPVEPPPTQGGVSRPTPRRRPHQIHGHADLRLPVPVLQALGFVLPAPIHARFDGTLPGLQLEVSGQASAAAIAGTWTFTLPAFEISATGSSSVPRPRAGRTRTRADDEEEQLLLEYYMLTLKGED